MEAHSNSKRDMPPKIYCGNNELSARLKRNGGDEVFGTHTECLRKGYGIALHTPIRDPARFIAEYGGPYRAHINQNLSYGDISQPGTQPATLAQALARGFGLGCVSRARKLKAQARRSENKDVKVNATDPRVQQRRRVPGHG